MTNELPEHSPVELQADDCGALITISRQWYEEAISALRAQEKEACECGCDVCNRNFSGNGLMRVREGTYLVLREIRDIVDAKYCPMCGRPLK